MEHHVGQDAILVLVILRLSRKSILRTKQLHYLQQRTKIKQESKLLKIIASGRQSFISRTFGARRHSHSVERYKYSVANLSGCFFAEVSKWKRQDEKKKTPPKAGLTNLSSRHSHQFSDEQSGVLPLQHSWFGPGGHPHTP